MVSCGTPRRSARYDRPAGVLNSTSRSSVARSLMPTTTSVLVTLWISGMCLSPMPWMLCSPKPFSSIVGHSSASTATMIEPCSSFSRSPAAIVPAEPVALTNAASRARRRGRRLEHVVQRPAGDLQVAEVVAELAELVEHEVRRVLGERVARVVDLLDVALRADRADDVLGRVLAPPVEPVEALLAHALGEDGDAAAGHEPADGDAAAGVVAGARPDRPVAGGVELAGDHPRREAGVGGEHLVGADHREAVAEDDDDRAVDAGQLLGQHDVVGDVDATAVRGRCTSAAATGCVRRGRGGRRRRRAPGRPCAGLGQLGERRQDDPLLAEPGDAVGQRGVVDDPVGEAELVLQGSSDVASRWTILPSHSPRVRLRNRYACRRWPS